MFQSRRMHSREVAKSIIAYVAAHGPGPDSARKWSDKHVNFADLPADERHAPTPVYGDLYDEYGEPIPPELYEGEEDASLDGFRIEGFSIFAKHQAEARRKARELAARRALQEE